MKDKITGWIRSRKCVQFISFFLFCALAVNLFLKITYLFRSAAADDHSAQPNRERIVGIKTEQDLDVVYIGGSAAFTYWQPPRAWAEYGIKSYNYATNSIPAEAIIGNIREIRKTHEPELFVIGVRSFQYWSEQVNDTEIRYITDSMDYSLNRWRMVYEYLSNRNVTDDIDVTSLYFDIAKYHTNFGVLNNSSQWKLMDNEGSSEYNGWMVYPGQESLERPMNLVEERTELAEGSREVLLELLEYCSEENLQVLFVVSPYWIDADQQTVFNAMGDLIETYGFGYLDANKFYDEMGIDFATDFQDIRHVNVYGSEKFTRFLAEYIKENYQLPDHRGEENTEEWDEMYQSFCVTEAAEKASINQKITDGIAAYDNGKKLKDIDNPYEWCAKAMNENYTVLMESQGEKLQLNTQTKFLFDQWEIPYGDASDIIRVYSGEESLYAENAALAENYKGEFEGHSDRVTGYEINSGDKGTILIEGIECGLGREGLNIVVYDNNYREVLDSVVITQPENGELTVQR